MLFDTTELICLLLVLFAVFRALNSQTRSILLTSKTVQRGVLALSLILVGFWSLTAGLVTGLSIHLLAITSITLIFGPRIAIVCAFLAHLLQLCFGLVPITYIASDALFTSVLPILFNYCILLITYQYLPRHPFVYIFINAFFVAGMTALFHMACITAYHYLAGHYDWQVLYDNYVFIAILIWFPEATINGIVITILIVYRPQWVRTFYEKEYFK